MKISEEHYDYLKSKISGLPRDSIKKYYMYLMSHDLRSKDKQKRLRWDVLDAVVKSDWVCDNLYSYLDDSHIDTALKNIFKENRIMEYCDEAV